MVVGRWSLDVGRCVAFDFRLSAFDSIYALHHGHLLVVGDIERVLGGIGRLGETEHIDSVEHVGLALPVQTDQAVELGREGHRRLADVAIVEYVQFCEDHISDPPCMADARHIG